MTDLAILHARALDEFGRRVRLITRTQWSDPTPCTDWTVRDLVNHVTVEQLWAPDVLAGKTIAEVGDRYAGDQLGDDPVAAWERAAAGAGTAFRAGGALLGKVHLSYGTVAASHYAAEMAVDVIVHAWDLARAINAIERLDDELVGYALEQGEARGSSLAESGYFAPALPVARDADKMTRMLALYGRAI